MLDRLLFSQIRNRFMLSHFLRGILAKDPGQLPAKDWNKTCLSVVSPWEVTRQLSDFLQAIKKLFSKKGTKFRLSIVARHWKKVPNFDLQLVAVTLKKGTKFRVLFGGGKTQRTHVISLKRNKKVPFSTKRVFLTNIEKSHHYLVRYQ